MLLKCDPSPTHGTCPFHKLDGVTPGGVASGAEKQSDTAVNHSNAPVSALSATQQPPAGGG